MSSFKNAEKKFQRIHRERGQPHLRRKMGYLEKKKDYKARAEDYQSKEKALKKLREKALNKNQDEFHFHMINSKVVDGRHYEKRKDEFTPEQLKLIQSQDLKYIEMKRKMELEKINKLKATLHLINFPAGPSTSKHILFVDEEDEEDPEERIHKLQESEVGGPPTKRQLKAYRELNRREERLKQLTALIEKIKGKNVDSKKRFVKERKR